MPHPRDEFDLAAILGATPFAGQIGLELLKATPDRVVGRLDWAEELCTVGGILHGGVLMSLADGAGAVCAFLNLPDRASTSTIESKTNFFRPVREGWVEAVSSPLHVGRTTIVVQTMLIRSDGNVAAQTTQTQAVLAD